MKFKKAIYIILGCLGVGLATLGAIILLLPAFPFLMLSAFCFAKSSKRLHNWLISTKLYKNNFESFAKGMGMTWKTKLKIIAVVTFTMSFGFIMMSNVPVGRVVLACVWVFHVFYFIFGVKNLSENSADKYQYELLIGIEGMYCQKCAGRIECLLKKEKGLCANVDFDSKMAILRANKPLDNQRLVSIINGAGYKVVEVKNRSAA